MRHNNPVRMRVWLEDIAVIGSSPEGLGQGFPLDRKSQTGIMTPGFSSLNPLIITH